MTKIERRVIELEFYITIQLLYNIKRNADFLVAMLEGLRFIVDFDVEKIVYYVNQFNLNNVWRPYKGEILGVLYKYSKMPISTICTALGMSRTTGYKLADTYLKDPYDIQPKVPEEDLIDLQNVIKAYKELRSVIKNNV